MASKLLNKNFLIKLFNLEQVTLQGVEIQGDTVELTVNPLHSLHYCPQCSQPINLPVDITPKTYRDLDLAGRVCYIQVRLKRFECGECRHTFTEQLPFITPYRHYTKRFEREVYECCRETTSAYTALKFGINDKTVFDIYTNLAKQKYHEPKQTLLTRVIGFDEIALHKGHKNFIIVITDLTNKRVIDVLPDRKKSTLKACIEKWSTEFKKNIKSIAIDLWGPYRSVAESVLPNAQVVADRFHVMQNINKALDNCRKHAKCKSSNQKIWKNAKYVVLKNREHLTEDEEKVLQDVLMDSADLKLCYEFKEQLRAIFNDSLDKNTGYVKLSAWILDVVRLQIVMYYGFVKTLLHWLENILNYFNEFVSSGFVEGVNNKIKLIKRKAFGFTNFENFRTKIIDNFS